MITVFARSALNVENIDRLVRSNRNVYRAQSGFMTSWWREIKSSGVKFHTDAFISSISIIAPSLNFPAYLLLEI